MPIIPLSEAAGGGTPAGAVLYHRASSPSQAGPGGEKLSEKARAAYWEVRRAAPAIPVLAIVRGVEEGKLSARRPKLLEAVQMAVRWAARRPRVILVATDVSRFVRAESYHRIENPE